MTEVVLAVNKLTVYRGTNAAVQEVSFTLAAGVDLAIIGPNGAGKSTLAQAILGIIPRQAGEGSILGHPLNGTQSLPVGIRQQVAYLPQNFAFDRRIPLTVAEFVGLGWDTLEFQLPWVGSRRRARSVAEALDRVDATHLRHQLISGLSGGEIKRVLLAYCLVRPRRLLILDEGCAGLDLPGQIAFYHLLSRLKQEEGWAILQISHDLPRVRRECDQVLCLNRTILCQGSPDVILSPERLSALYGPEFVGYWSSH